MTTLLPTHFTNTSTWQQKTQAKGAGTGSPGFRQTHGRQHFPIPRTEHQARTPPGTGLQFEPPLDKGRESIPAWHSSTTYAQQPTPPPLKCHIVETPQEFDQPGAELDRDAQVWKTYVQESDRVDAERVDGWNKTLDVILIFAALFSAISTAFVIESYKNLKQDPADVSASTLLTISQTLLIMANASQPANLPLPTSTEPTQFKAPLSAVLVNALWFLSLSLSVAVSLIAMLAKEWCFTFMSGRTGSPIAQSRRRQQRWDGLVNWKMQEVLMVLPSLIHLALLLFAIGLSIFLWHIHLAVALPVVVIACVAVSIYVTCTVLPFIDNYCPYGTTLSRMYRRLYGIDIQPTSDDTKQDIVTSQTLHWMITNCETPRSVDVALQSLAGASDDLPLHKLEKCQTLQLVGERFMAAHPYNRQPNPAASLYSRALLAWGSRRHHEYDRSFKQSNQSGRLDTILWILQSRIDSLCEGVCTPSGNPRPGGRGSTDEIIRWSRMVAHHCIEALRYDETESPEYGEQPSSLALKYAESASNLHVIGAITRILEQHIGGGVHLERGALDALWTSFAILLCCSLFHCSPPVAVRFLLRSVRASTVQPGDISYRGLALSLAAFAFSRQDYPGRPDHFLLNPVARVERAVDVILHYILHSNSWGSNNFVTYSLVSLGLLHLLSHSQLYDLQDDDFRAIHMLYPLPGFSVSHIYTLPVDFSFHSQTIGDIDRHISECPDVYTSEAHVLACAAALNLAYDFKQSAPTAKTYVFVVESIFHDSGNIGNPPGLALLDHLPFPSLSDELADSLSARRIVPLLAGFLNHESLDLQLISWSQLWLLVTILSNSGNSASAAHQALETELLNFTLLKNNLHKLEQVARALAEPFSMLLEGRLKDRWVHQIGDTYFCRILECMLQAENCSLSDPRWKMVNENLSHIPGRLRGLASFVCLDRS